MLFLLFLFISSAFSGPSHQYGTYSIAPPITENCLPLAPDLHEGVNFIHGAINQLNINKTTNEVVLLLNIDPSVWDTLAPLLTTSLSLTPGTAEFDSYKAYLTTMIITCNATWSVDSNGYDVVSLSGTALASIPPEELAELEKDLQAYSTAKNLLPYVFATCSLQATGVLTFDMVDAFSGTWSIKYNDFCDGKDSDGNPLMSMYGDVLGEKFASDSCVSKSGHVWGLYGNVPPVVTSSPTSTPSMTTPSSMTNSSATSMSSTLSFVSLFVLIVHA